MSESPELDANAVHLWAIDVSAPEHAPRPDDGGAKWRVGPESYASVAELHTLTTAAERERAARFKRPGDGDRFLRARAALRRILGGYLACEPLALSFSYGEWGKPTIRETSLCFNLSHSAALVLVAVALGRQVGVDVERQREISDLDGMATRICTPRELRELEAVALADRPGAFLALWTRKEALAKMTGEGVRALARDASHEAQDDCRLEQVLDLPGYAACVAAQGRDWRLVRFALAARLALDP